jgi:succinyl-diaminopimelate desuccinylase
MSEEIIRHLTQFVSFRTIAGANDAKQECIDWAQEAFLKDWKGDDPVHGSVEDTPYLYLPHQDSKLLFFAHLDVVPAKDHQFDLKQEGDKLIGRGTSDMKGNQLPFLLALRDALARGEDPSVSVLLTSDEETAGPTIPHLLETGVIKDIPVAFTPDTRERIVVEHKGVLWAELICKGKGSHAAYPWDGENPNFLLAEALQIIQREFPQGTKDDWQVTVTPTKLTGSVARNQIPEIASAGIDIRFPSQVCDSPDEAKALVEKHLPKGCSLEVVLSADPLGTDPNHSMVQLVKKIAEEVRREEVIFEREHGGTDARYFGASGIPSFLYGPVGEGLHGADEWVSLKSLEEQYEMNVKLLQELM